MTSFYDEFMPFLIFVTLMVIGLQIGQLRKEIRELKEMFQQWLPSAGPIGSEQD